MNKYPKSDELMTYDFDEHRYILTGKDVLDELGENLAVRLNKGRANNIENVVKNFLDMISSDVYDFIYTTNIKNKEQCYVIATTETGRKLIKRAMEQQVLYVLTNGDLNLFAGVDVRKGVVMEHFEDRAISPKAKRTLSNVIPEIGQSVLYSGYLRFKAPSYEEGGY